MNSVRDVVIVGGGVMGCSVAFFLKTLAPELSVMVVERDPTYATASSALSASSIRQHFSVPANVLLSQQSFAFLRDVASHLSVEDTVAEIGLIERGYLYLASDEAVAVLRAGHDVQTRCGAEMALLDPTDLSERFPWLATEGVAMASLGLRGEGWFDGYSLLQAFRRKAKSMGVEFVTAEVTGLAFTAGDAAKVRLDDGRQVACASVVNAAGPQAGRLAKLAGIDIPIVAERHCIFVFECPQTISECPLVVDPSGIYFRPEGRQFIAGVPPRAGEEPTDRLDVDHSLFDDVLWPTLAQRVPAFEAIRPAGAWAGWYDMNTFDRNALIGAWPGCPNFYFINGFSGHGIQQSPAAGRALAEIIVLGASRSIDIAALGPDRLLVNAPIEELNII